MFAHSRVCLVLDPDLQADEVISEVCESARGRSKKEKRIIEQLNQSRQGRVAVSYPAYV